MNKKGVTLIELIIVIVIIGIISAFAVPAVSRYLTTAQKSAVLRDAQEFRSAANSLCIEESCATDDVYDQDDLASLIENFDTGKYDTMTATKTADGWTIVLDVDPTNGTGTSAYEYVTEPAVDPIDATVDNVSDAE
jgi:type IV pilus assembly protein PilA